jgi:maleylacetoacetate isomerase/maleylpyruvate isomerase
LRANDRGARIVADRPAPRQATLATQGGSPGGATHDPGVGARANILPTRGDAPRPTMKLYTYFRSSAAYRVRIALALKGLPWEAVPVNLAQGSHRELPFRDVNPQALVPALEDGGEILTQSLAIIEYLEETHPEPPLLPRAPRDRAHARAVAQIVACEIHPLNNLRTLKYLRRTFGLDDAGVNAWYRHWIADGLAMLEAFLAAKRRSGPYCCGEQVTIADCCLVPQIFNARRYECPLDPYPLTMAAFAACMRLEAFASTQPSQQPDAA